MMTLGIFVCLPASCVTGATGRAGAKGRRGRVLGGDVRLGAGLEEREAVPEMGVEARVR